jgi:hypothetical protein
VFFFGWTIRTFVWPLTKIAVADHASCFASGLGSIHEAYYIEFDLQYQLWDWKRDIRAIFYIHPICESFLEAMNEIALHRFMDS